jgi:protoheme ferro-lyase
LDDEPRPEAAVIKALNEGASEIIVSFVFVSISSHTVEGKEAIKSIKPEDYGVALKFTQPLWDSSALHNMFLEKSNTIIRNREKSKVGILLVAHGQPEEWDELFPLQTKHEIAFREKIKEKLIQNGYQEDKINLVWMEFKHPKPEESINKLLKSNIDMILYFSASISAEAIHSQYDVPELVNRADIPKNIEVVNMGAWNNHPQVIKAIKEKIDELMKTN